MNKTHRIGLAALSFLALGANAHATTITVTPAQLGGPGTTALNTWYTDNYRGSTTVGAITGAQPRNGNGSAQMSSSDANAKVDFIYTWGFVRGRTLGNLDALGFDWYRDGSSQATDHFVPALRLLYDADGDMGTANDRGYLVWERIYNVPLADRPAPTDQWTSSELLNQIFWQRQFSPGLTIENYQTTLAQWTAGAQPAGADKLGANTAILGIEFGIGSGWNGSFTGYVDNVSYGFAGEGSTTFNFETAAADVPEPASLALLGLGLAGLVARRRRKA